MGKIICVKKCSNCGKDIEIKYKQRLERKNIFCCKECELEYKKRERESKTGYYNCECPICHKKFHLKPYQKNKYKTHYCSRKCFAIAKIDIMSGKNNHQYGLKGKLNASWKSDKKLTNYGYIKIRCLDHPYKDCDDFIFEHRLVAEKYLLNDENSIEINGKRYLKKEYTVHHIDGNKTNNNPNNLKTMTLQEHSKLHNMNRKNNKPVDQFDLNNNYIRTYNSIKEAGEINNIRPQNISKCCKHNKRTAGKYIWKYSK